MQTRLRLSVALSALVLVMAPLPRAYAGANSGTKMLTNAANATLPDARNNLLVTRILTDFGAKCDGTTDDSAAFTAAVNWLKTAASRTVALPAATCATSQTVTLGDGRQRSTTLSSDGSTGNSSLTVTSIAGINNGDAVLLQLNSGSYRGTVNGAPSGNSVPITPELTGAASSGKIIITGQSSTYSGGGFVGFGSGGSDSETNTTLSNISAIKYIGAAAPTTTLTATASVGALTLTVASISNFALGNAIGITLDNGAMWWTHVTQTPTGSTVNIANEVPSTTTSGNTVTIANNPVARIAGPIVGPVLSGVKLDANSLAAIGLETIHAVGGKFQGPRGVVAANYTGIGFYLHSQEGYLAVSIGSEDNDFELYALDPANNKTIGLWINGGGTAAVQTVCFCRNRFHGGTFYEGGNDLTAASIREEFVDNNTFIKPFASINYKSGASAGAGLYRQPTYNKSNFPNENNWINPAIINGVTDGTATGGTIYNDYFSSYDVSDGEPIPTGKEAGVTTTGVYFGATQVNLANGGSASAPTLQLATNGGNNGGCWGNVGSAAFNCGSSGNTGFIVNTGGGFQSHILTASKTSNYTINNATDFAIHYDNIGAGSEVDITLPAAGGQRNYCFSVYVAQILKVIAGAGDKIAIGGTNSATAGNVTSNLPFSALCVEAHAAGQWVTTSVTGTWTVN